MHNGSDQATAIKQAASFKPAEPIQPNEAGENVDLYEIEEEIEEVQETEEIAEEENKVVEEEEEAEEMIEQNVTAEVGDDSSNADMDMKDYKIEDDEAGNHAALLALPSDGCEICIAGVSSDISEEELRTFCGSVGQITRFKPWQRGSSKNLYYAFVEYKSEELAAKAVQELNDATLKGKKLSCSKAHSKCTLFIGNIPRSMTEDVLRETLAKIGPGVRKVHLKGDSSGYGDQGFAFVEYYNHACADYSRNKMCDPKFKLNSNAPMVTLAFPEVDVRQTIYVRNLPKNVTQDQLRWLFEHHGEITKVDLPPAKFGKEYRIGFVHFAQQSSAIRALRNSEKYYLDDQLLECYLAKSQTKKEGETGPNTQEGPLSLKVSPQEGVICFEHK